MKNKSAEKKYNHSKLLRLTSSAFFLPPYAIDYKS